MTKVLPCCTNLLTLCVRDDYNLDSYSYIGDFHIYVCNYIEPLAQWTPASVTALQIRSSFPFLDRLAQALEQYNSSTAAIGIDLDARVQIYPHKAERYIPPVAPSKRLFYSEIEEATLRAAAKDRHDAYVEENTNLMPLDTKSRLLPFKPSDMPGPVARNVLDSTYYGDGPRIIERPAWADDSWSVCTEHGDGDVPTHDTILGDYNAKKPDRHAILDA
jgi:hypothetical protein